MLPFCDFTIPKWLPSSAQRFTVWHRFSLRLPFRELVNSHTKLQRHPYGISRFPSSADLFRASSVLDFQNKTVQHPTYQSIKTAKPNHSNQPTNMPKNNCSNMLDALVRLWWSNTLDLHSHVKHVQSAQ